MVTILKNIDWYIHITMIVSIGLMIASFCLPPTGVIDNSVLAGAGELGTMAAIFTFLTRLPQYIKSGATTRIQRGNMSIEVGVDKDHDGDKISDSEAT